MTLVATLRYVVTSVLLFGRRCPQCWVLRESAISKDGKRQNHGTPFALDLSLDSRNSACFVSNLRVKCNSFAVYFDTVFWHLFGTLKALADCEDWILKSGRSEKSCSATCAVIRVRLVHFVICDCCDGQINFFGFYLKHSIDSSLSRTLVQHPVNKCWREFNLLLSRALS